MSIDSNGVNEIMLYGDIGESWYGDGITEAQVLSGLKGLDPTASQHDIRINSPGGRVDTGLAIRSLLSSHASQMRVFNPDFKLATIVDGVAYSVASVILMAGDVRRIALGGIVMIHDACTFAYGNEAEFRKEADNMAQLSKNAATVYASAVNQKDKDAAYFRTLMLAETYFIGDEALTAGLATEVEQTQAQLFADLSPEMIKKIGYAKLMATKDRNRVYRRPLSTQSLSDRKAAAQRLQLLAAEIHQ